MTLSELALKVGVGASTVRKWETGYIKDMRSDKIQKVAAALNVTETYLMGWDEDKSVNVNSVHKSNGIIGHANASVTINGKTQFTKEEQELLRIYNELSVKGRAALIVSAYDLEAREKRTE
jgi:transcriptional regulator with XRE-family HTH domain